MTLQELLNQLVDEVLQSKSLEEVKGAIIAAKYTLEQSNITYDSQKWFWDELKHRIENNDTILKEALAAAALNDLVAYALATIQQVSGNEKTK